MGNKLFNSNGKLIEMPLKAEKSEFYIQTADIFFADISDADASVSEVSKYIKACIKSGWMYKTKKHRLFLFREYKNNSAKSVAGIVLFFNQADGHLCKVKLEMGNGPILKHDDLLNQDVILLFEELTALCRINGKDFTSWDKNAYILAAETPPANRKENAKKVWKTYCELKKFSSEGSTCSYDAQGNVFYERHGRRLVHIRDGICFSNGNAYRSLDSFLKAELSGRNEINQKMLGNMESDAVFMEYLRSGYMLK